MFAHLEKYVGIKFTCTHTGESNRGTSSPMFGNYQTDTVHRGVQGIERSANSARGTNKRDSRSQFGKTGGHSKTSERSFVCYCSLLCGPFSKKELREDGANAF